MEHPEEMSKFAKIKAQVAEVKGVMKDNIDKVSNPDVRSIDNAGRHRNRSTYSRGNSNVVRTFLCSHRCCFQVLQRGEKMELLAEQADSLSSEVRLLCLAGWFLLILGLNFFGCFWQATRFQVQGKALHKKMWWENLRAKAVIIGILIALALIIWLSVCHGFVCN